MIDELCGEDNVPGVQEPRQGTGPPGGKVHYVSRSVAYSVCTG